MHATDYSSLNSTVAAVTAFGTWDELEAAMSTGYVPTIYGRTRRERQLIAAITAAGYAVWGNSGRNW